MMNGYYAIPVTGLTVLVERLAVIAEMNRHLESFHRDRVAYTDIREAHMAKLSSRLRNEKRKQLVEKYVERRKALKAVIKEQACTPEEKQAAQNELNRLPRNSSAVRLRNRCAISGRVRGYLGRFDMSRIDFRLLALRGAIPGVRKSSW